MFLYPPLVIIYMYLFKINIKNIKKMLFSIVFFVLLYYNTFIKFNKVFFDKFLKI